MWLRDAKTPMNLDFYDQCSSPFRTQYNNSEMMRYNEERKRLQEAPGERLLFISPSNKNATSLQHRAVIELLSKMNNERLERIDKVWGPFEDAPVGSRMALLAVVDGRWMNSAGSDVPGLVWLTLWQPGKAHWGHVTFRRLLTQLS